MKTNVTIIVKYYYPMKRHSGILNLVRYLSKELSKLCDLNIVTWAYKNNLPQKESFDGYTIHRVKGFFAATSAIKARKLNADVIIYITGIYKLILLFPYLLIMKLFLLNKPLLLAQYSAMDNKNDFIQILINPLIKKIIAVSPDIKKFYNKHLSHKTTYIPAGLDIACIKSSKKKLFNNNFPVIGFFGHLNYNKGSDRIIAAWQKANKPSINIVLAGEGELQQNYHNLAKKNNNIKVYGYLENIQDYINSCDALVFPYRNQVSILGLSMSAIEGMAMGKPLIVSPNTCLEPLVESGINGIIFNNNLELSNTLAGISNGKINLKKMSVKALKMSSNYDIKEIATKYYKLIKETHEGK